MRCISHEMVNIDGERIGWKPVLPFPDGYKCSWLIPPMLPWHSALVSLPLSLQCRSMMYSHPYILYIGTTL